MIENKSERIRIKDIAIKAGVSVGTVDRVIHGRSGVSESSKKKVEEILKQMNYQPNMYASALASNKKYNLACILPTHTNEDYWIDVEAGMNHAVSAYKDFNISLNISYYDQYESGAFAEAAQKMFETMPDGVIMAPSSEKETRPIALQLQERNTPFVFIDSNIKSLNPLSFYGQNSHSSGYFAARILSLMAEHNEPVVIFRLIYGGKLGSNQQQNREEGFREYIKKNCPEIKLYELNFYVKNPENNEKIMEEFFAEHPEINFYKMDIDKFIMLKLAYECGRKGGLYPCILNAANEICVYSFLEKKIGFTDIFNIVSKICNRKINIPLTIENIINMDNEIRKETAWMIDSMKK